MQPGPNGAIARHGGEPGDARAAKQLQQQRLDLVVAMLGGDQHFARLHAPAQQVRSARRARRLRATRRCVRWMFAFSATNGTRQARAMRAQCRLHSPLAACSP